MLYAAIFRATARLVNRLALIALCLLLSACNLHKQASSTQQTAAPTAQAAQGRLQALALAAPVAPGALWLWHDGDPIPAGVEAQRWTLAQFVAQQHDGGQWREFGDELAHEFPGGVQVVRMHGLYVIEGRAAWGTGGFISTVQDTKS